MAHRYVCSKNADGNHHEVHVTGCFYIDNIKTENRVPLGVHASHREAVADAKRRFPGTQFDGCGHCSSPEYMHIR